MASRAPKAPKEVKKAARSEGKVLESGEKDFQGKDDGMVEDCSVSSRERLREELNSAVEAYLASGGKIERVDPHVTADPPKKPDNNYGSRPI